MSLTILKREDQMVKLSFQHWYDENDLVIYRGIISMISPTLVWCPAYWDHQWFPPWCAFSHLMSGHKQRLSHCSQRAHLEISSQWILCLQEIDFWRTFDNALGSGIVDLGLCHVWFQHFVNDVHFSLGKINLHDSILETNVSQRPTHSNQTHPNGDTLVVRGSRWELHNNLRACFLLCGVQWTDSVNKSRIRMVLLKSSKKLSNKTNYCDLLKCIFSYFSWLINSFSWNITRRPLRNLF